MIAGKKYFGPTADIWSIGVILFALVCGFLPFEDANTSVLYKKILAGDYKPPKWISPEVKDLIRCILEVDPKKRFVVADIKRHPWYNIISEESVPKEVINHEENEMTKIEILKSVKDAGMDCQAVLEGTIYILFVWFYDAALYYINHNCNNNNINNKNYNKNDSINN